MAMKESIYYSVADAVEDEAVEADQEARMQSELTEIPFGMQGAKFASYAHYMRHLNDLTSHKALMRSVSNSLWRGTKLQKRKDTLERFHTLFE